MHASTVRHWSYRIALLLAGLYLVYVVVMKLQNSTSGGALGDVGEFLLVLASVTAFAVGLFADEALRRHQVTDHPDI